jgi:hypothetical protein
MRLWLERAPLFELLPNPAHGRHTKAQELRNFTGALIPFVKVDDSLARQQWYRSHDKTDSATRTPPKASYIIYGNALKCTFSPVLHGLGRLAKPGAKRQT